MSDLSDASGIIGGILAMAAFGGYVWVLFRIADLVDFLRRKRRWGGE
jgi:hypothetical protein